MMQTISTENIRRVHALLAKMGLANDKEYKRSLIESYTDGRETSTKALYVNEAGQLLTDLQRMVDKHMTAQEIKVNDKRRLLLHYAHDMGWELDGEAVERKKVDMVRVNDWCVRYGYLHKPLNDYSLTELSKLIVQMQEALKHHLNKL